MYLFFLAPRCEPSQFFFPRHASAKSSRQGPGNFVATEEKPAQHASGNFACTGAANILKWKEEEEKKNCYLKIGWENLSFEQTVVLRVEEKEEKREERRIFKFEFELAEFQIWISANWILKFEFQLIPNLNFNQIWVSIN